MHFSYWFVEWSEKLKRKMILHILIHEPKERGLRVANQQQESVYGELSALQSLLNQLVRNLIWEEEAFCVNHSMWCQRFGSTNVSFSSSFSTWTSCSYLKVTLYKMFNIEFFPPLSVEPMYRCWITIKWIAKKNWCKRKSNFCWWI